MTLLPELERRLVDAAGRPSRRLPRPGPVLRLALPGLAAVLAVVALVGGGRASAPPAADSPSADVPMGTLAKARALAEAPALVAGPRLDAGAMMATVRRIQGDLPYPPGTTDDLLTVVHPPRSATDMSAVSVERDARMLGEYRAWCSWQRYWLTTSGARRAGATSVLETAPEWPSFRRGTNGQARAIARAATSGQTAPIRAHVTLNCADHPQTGG